MLAAEVRKEGARQGSKRSRQIFDGCPTLTDIRRFHCYGYVFC